MTELSQSFEEAQSLAMTELTVRHPWYRHAAISVTKNASTPQHFIFATYLSSIQLFNYMKCFVTTS